MPQEEQARESGRFVAAPAKSKECKKNKKESKGVFGSARRVQELAKSDSAAWLAKEESLGS